MLPQYAGSAIRGAFGHALRKVSCVPQCKSANSCIIGNRCAYFYAFESKHPDADTGFENSPHPFVFEPPEGGIYTSLSLIQFQLLLIGESVQFLPYYIYSLIQMGENGLGKGRGRFELVNILDDNGNIVFDTTDGKLISHGIRRYIEQYNAQNRVEMKILTPLRLKSSGNYDYSPSFETIVRATLRRASMLSKLYCNAQLNIDFADIINRARTVKTVNSSAHKVIIERYSARQQRVVPLYGCRGALTYEGDFAHFKYILDVARQLHVGGATAFGFGKIDVT